MNERVYRSILARHGIVPKPEPLDPAIVAQVLGTPLGLLDVLLEVRVGWYPETLWFVGGEVAAEALVAEGVSRGRIWTSHELRDFLVFPPRVVQTVARALFDGEVVAIRPSVE